MGLVALSTRSRNSLPQYGEFGGLLIGGDLQGNHCQNEIYFCCIENQHTPITIATVLQPKSRAEQMHVGKTPEFYCVISLMDGSIVDAIYRRVTVLND